MRRPLIVTLLVSSLAAATDEAPTISFKLPNACGHPVQVPDLGARYALLVYQGIP